MHMAIDLGHNVTPRQRDNFPDEVQETPATEAVQDMIDARMNNPKIGDLVGDMKRIKYVPHKNGFIDPAAVRPKSTGLIGYAGGDFSK